jgi:hypothetical protein
MGTRQPAHLSRPVYGLPEGTAPSELSRGPSALLPLLLLFVVLAAASVWFVALPAFAKPVRAERSCEVIVLATGTTKCVRNPTHRAGATPRTSHGRHTR